MLRVLLTDLCSTVTLAPPPCKFGVHSLMLIHSCTAYITAGKVWNSHPLKRLIIYLPNIHNYYVPRKLVYTHVKSDELHIWNVHCISLSVRLTRIANVTYTTVMQYANVHTTLCVHSYKNKRTSVSLASPTDFWESKPPGLFDNSTFSRISAKKQTKESFFTHTGWLHKYCRVCVLCWKGLCCSNETWVTEWAKRANWKSGTCTFSEL